MDAMCKIGYKNKNAYFSIYCAKMLNFIMEKKCSTLKNTTEFNKIVCSKKTPCEHFVCAIPNGFKLQGRRIPKQNNRKGLTSKASMYTNCGFDPKYPKV
ncbi:hypothetical protein HZS_2809 [Henneguya salminicola]|nr:hypothetical protein HZS_2809 [Henneguya salminicola]